MTNFNNNKPTGPWLLFYLTFFFFLFINISGTSSQINSNLESQSKGQGRQLKPTDSPHQYADPVIFIYHRFGEERYPSTNVSIERFEEQLEYLRTNKYQVLPLSIVLQYIAANKPLPPKTTVITIDDGYKSVYEKAWPVLRDFGYPFTVFIYVKATDNNHWDYMTWDQVRELQRAGVDFQSHGYAHNRFGTPTDSMTLEEYKNQIVTDFTYSSDLMKKKLGIRPSYLAAPYGEYNKIIITAAKTAGYSALLTQDPGPVSNHTNLFSVPREPILGVDWSTMEHFSKVLDRIDLPFTEIFPNFERLQNPMPKRFNANLLFPNNYIPGTLGVYISELGWQPASLDGSIVGIENTKPLKRRLNRIAISGRDKESGRIAIRFRLLVNQTNKEQMEN